MTRPATQARSQGRKPEHHRWKGLCCWERWLPRLTLRILQPFNHPYFTTDAEPTHPTNRGRRRSIRQRRLKSASTESSANESRRTRRMVGVLLETRRYGSQGAEGNEREAAEGFFLVSHRLHYVDPPGTQIPPLIFGHGCWRIPLLLPHLRIQERLILDQSKVNQIRHRALIHLATTHKQADQSADATPPSLTSSCTLVAWLRS